MSNALQTSQDNSVSSEVFDGSNFSEADHPRDGAGKFSSKNGHVGAKDPPAGAALRKRWTNDFAGVVKEYSSQTGEFDTRGGTVLNTDLARELSPEYRRDRSTSADVHEAASDLIKAMYAEKLSKPTPKGKDRTVLFTAGGTGSGKSTGERKVAAEGLIGDPEIVYDTNMNGMESSDKKIQQALKAGRNVEILYTYRDPVDALVKGALPRADRMEKEHGTGRTVPVEEHAKTHIGAYRTMKALSEKYAGDSRVKFMFIDNSRGKGRESRVDSLDELPVPGYYKDVPKGGTSHGNDAPTEAGRDRQDSERRRRSRETGSDSGGNPVRSLSSTLRERLEEERQAGRISERTHRGFAGGVTHDSASRQLFDDAGTGQPLTALARLKLARELATIKTDIAVAGTGPLGAVKRLKLVARANQVRIQLGISAAQPKNNGPKPGADGEESLPPRTPTAQFYGFDAKRKPAQRKRENAAAMALLAKIDTGELDPAKLTEDEKATLAKYSGKGGGLTDASGKTGSAYEYYTPKPIAEGIWSMMAELGFSGGRVLDPSAGTGIFGATAPMNAVVDAVELNSTSGRINALVNGGPGHSVTVSPFERVAAVTPDESYDAVVTNVPFGDVSARGNNFKHDDRYQDEPLQNYFILRTLEKLRPGGLAVFITPTSCVSGKDKRSLSLRVRASYMAEFLGAYRLPNEIFDTAAADVTTDVIAFRKYSRDTLDKIEELREQSPQTLVEANVQWQEFINGRYFSGDGHRFILGEIEAGKGRWGEQERVITRQPVGEVAKMLRRFPDSRVDWKLLDAKETENIVYRDGDTQTQGGQTLEYKDGVWHPLNKPEGAATDPALISGDVMQDAYTAWQAGVTYSQANAWLGHMAAQSLNLDVPGWVFAAMRHIDRLSAGERDKWWKAGLVGMSVQYVINERMSMEAGVNYLEEYPALSDAMQTFAKMAKSAPSSLGGALSEGLRAIGVHYRAKTGFSEVWRGDVNMDTAAPVDASRAYEGLRYESRSPWVDAAAAKEILGDDFDPIKSPDWLVSADGKKVIRANDFYVGNVAEAHAKLDAEIASAENDEIKGKLLWAKAHAETRIHTIDVGEINFNWSSPFATLQEKLDFARIYVHKSAYIDTDGKGEQMVKLDLSSVDKQSDRGKLTMRLSEYLSSGTVSLRGAEIAMKEADAMTELRRMIATVNQQFDGWCRGNRAIIGRLEEAAKDTEKLRFRIPDDESVLTVPGINDFWNGGGLNSYKRSFIRKMGREFGGINGYGVGLGKTSAALIAVQYAQAIGVKNKTAFVVPNSVLSNWRKEAVIGGGGNPPIYKDASDCLFVGLRAKRGRQVIDISEADPNDKTIKFVVDSKYYDEDLQRVLTNKHRKIFLSMEAFERIKLRDETLDGFMGYMRRVDVLFAQSDSNKDRDAEKGASREAGILGILSNKIGSAPYLEDMGIDSLVIDEAHAYKNSSDVYDTESAKYLSLPPASKRGIDMQAKAWYVRGASPLRDGVLGLTATPITNSPLEIYSMLSLTIGHDRVNDNLLGCKGSDAFLAVMAQIDSIDEDGVDGESRNYKAFTGLNNVNIIRKAIGDHMTILTAEDVGMSIVAPDANEKTTPITLSSDIYAGLRKYVGAYRASRHPEKATADDKKSLTDVLQHFQIETGDIAGAGVFANAFNLINNMEMLLLDPELDERATFYTYDPAKAGEMAKVVNEFNESGYTEKRSRKGPHTEDKSVIATKSKKDGNSGLVVNQITIKVVAYIQGDKNRVLIDTMSPTIQDAFEALCEKRGILLDVSVPPKLAAMIANIQAEAANPRGVDDDGNHSPIVKQIIFCDRLSLHNKIRILLNKRAGIPSSKIAIITGQRNNDVEQILAVQDGFNAHGEDNKYQIVLANEKAEVGINLQRGTQAIHHLSIGWTPDSLTQRNGRGVRQGNKTASVSVYYYDADGTFDSYRRRTVSKKSEWIGAVMDVNGDNAVNVNGGISEAIYDAMIQAQGDSAALEKLQEKADAIEKMQRIERNRSNQLINAQNVIIARKNLAAIPDASGLVKARMATMFGIWKKAELARNTLQKAKITESDARKAKLRLENAEFEMAQMRRDIEASIEGLSVNEWNGSKEKTLDGLFRDAINARKSKDSGSHTEQEQQFIAKYAAFKIKDGSPLHDEWQFEVDRNNSDIKQYSESFSRQANQDGAMPKEVIDAILAGGGFMLGGKLLTAGTIVRNKDGGDRAFLMVENESSGWYLNTPTRSFLRTDIANTLGDDWVRSGDVILPGEAGYDDCLTEAAAIEDIAAGYGSEKFVFSKLVPDISLRRKVKGSVSYEMVKYRLLPPYFPFPVRNSGSEAVSAIFKLQAEVVRGFSSYPDTFKVAEGTEVIALPWNDSDKINALIDYAIANSLRLNLSDLGYSTTYIIQRIKVGAAAFAEQIAGETAEEITAKLESFVRTQITWYAFRDGDNFVGLIPWELRSVFDSKIRQANDARIAKELAENPASAPVSRASETEIVAITGDTKTWKDKIKAFAATYGSGRYRWDGANVVWNVYRSTWDALVQQYPQAAKELSLTTATIKRF